MKIGKKFNQMSVSEYRHFIDNRDKYTNFNTLGLYRSLLENEKLSVENKIGVRDYAHQFFGKFFNFLQLKDASTYVGVSTLGQELTKAEDTQLWRDVRKNQEAILKSKRIRHRNFGDYSKHNCGYDDCRYNGVMIRQGSWLSECSMGFVSDKSKHNAVAKSKHNKKQRKQWKNIRNSELEL